MSDPFVIVVVLNWNNPDDTIACVRSLKQLAYGNDVIVVVDNGSTDDSVERIQAAFPEITLLKNQENLGYAEGNNVGIRYALDREADYVCIVNNDVIVAPGFLRALVDEADKDPTIGIVGPKMYFYEPEDMLFAAGSLIDWDNGHLTHRGLWKMEEESAPFYPRPEDVDFIVGCGMLARGELIEEIGILDRRYYLNFEDVDWCVRARAAGYRVRYSPEAILWHKVSATLGFASPRNTYYMTRNALLFFNTYLSGWHRRFALLKIVLRNLGHTIAWTLKHDEQHAALAKRAATFRAIRDALLRRYGEMPV